MKCEPQPTPCADTTCPSHTHFFLKWNTEINNYSNSSFINNSSQSRLEDIKIFCQGTGTFLHIVMRPLVASGSGVRRPEFLSAYSCKMYNVQCTCDQVDTSIRCFLISLKTYSSKNGKTTVFQIFWVDLLLNFGHSLRICKNLDVWLSETWESIYGPKHMEMFPKRSQITGHKTASS